MISINGTLFFICVLNYFLCIHKNVKNGAFIVTSPQLENTTKKSFRRWNSRLQNNLKESTELQEDENLIRYKLANDLSSIIYKKRKNINKQRRLLNIGKCIVFPPDKKLTQEDTQFENPINYNYEELHVYMEINTGSVNEKKNQQGISHLCEHVSYMGSKNRKNIIDKNVRTNAYTDFHHIVFYISVSLNTEIYKDNSFIEIKKNDIIEQFCRQNMISDTETLALLKDEELINFDVYNLEEFNYKHKLLSQCIDTMVEVLEGKTQFTKERIQKEKKAIISEYSIINTVDYKINSDIIKTLHKENRLSHRLPIGKLELLKRYDENDLKRYFDLFFRTENANLYVYGDINVDIAKQMIKEKFEKVKKNKITENNLAFLNILNKNTLRGKNKNLPAVFHNFAEDSSNQNSFERTYTEKVTIENKQQSEHEEINEKTRNKDAILEKSQPQLDDNIIDMLKLKELKKNKDDINCELEFQKYLRNKYAVNIEEEKHLNKTEMKKIETSFEVFPYSLNNININILMKEEIKSIRTKEDFKKSLIKEIIFYCLSFRFNVHRNDLFNNIDINEYTNINEGATIRTIEIKTAENTFEKAIKTFYQFVKSVLIYGFSKDELKNYELNEIDFNIKEEETETETETEIETKTKIEEESKQTTVSTSSTSKNMKLVHPENIEDEYITDSKINEMYSEEIQKIIDYNSCNNIFMNEKREKLLKKNIFYQLQLEEINQFAKNYFQYLFNIFQKNTNCKPHCVVVHVPHNDSGETIKYNKNMVKNLFYQNIYTEEQVPNFSLNMQDTLLSDTYIFNNVTSNLKLAKYVTPQKSPYEDIFAHIINSFQQKQKKEQHLDEKENLFLFSNGELNTEPNFNLFKSIYEVELEQQNNFQTVDIISEAANENFLMTKHMRKEKETEQMIKIKEENNELVKQREKVEQDQNITMSAWNLKKHASLMNVKDVQNYELANGIKINLYKTKIDKKNLYFRLIIPHNKILKKKKPYVFPLLFSVLCLFEGGEIENISRENVEIHCNNKNINIYIDMNDELFYIDIYTYNKYENINSAFSILNNILLQTKIEEASLQRVVNKLKKDFFDYKNNLQSFLVGQTLSYLSGEAIGYQNFDLQMIENINLQQVKEELLDLFSDISLFELSIVGNISDFLHYYILHYIGTLKATNTKKKTIKTKIESEREMKKQYDTLCPVQNFEKKSKQITYVYLKEKEEHGIFLLVGKSANNYGILSNGIHISYYMLLLLNKLYNPSSYIKTENEEQGNNDNGKDLSLWGNLEKIRNYANLNVLDKNDWEELIWKKRKLYINPLFFSIVSYIVQFILNSKLFHYLREKKELTYDSSFEFINYEKYFTGFFTLLVQTNPKDLDLIRREVLVCFENYTKQFHNYSDYLIENAKLSYLNKRTKDLKFFIDKIFGMQLTHFPLKYKNKHLFKDSYILNQIEKIDVLLVVFILFHQTKTYHVSYGIAAPANIWANTFKNINQVSQ